jgi:hypothetical protein
MAKPVQWKGDGHPIRSDAQNPPKPGVRHKRAGLALPARIGLVVLLGVLTSACDSGKQPASTAASASQAPATRAPAAAAPADDCTTQADREAFIEKQIAQGHWQKVGRVARVFHIHVVPAFMTETSPDEQQQSLAVVSAYSQCEGGGSRLVIHDATTGEQIGEFSEAGLELK